MTTSANLTDWARAVPYGRRRHKQSPTDLRRLVQGFDTMLADSQPIALINEADFTVLGSKFNERAMARQRVVLVGAGETHWYTSPEDTVQRRAIGYDRSFLLHSYAFMAQKTKFLAYRSVLPWQITLHAHRRFLERGTAETALSLFDDRLLPAMMLVGPLSHAILHPQSLVRDDALALPYGRHLFRGVLRRVRITDAAHAEFRKSLYDRNGRHESGLMLRSGDCIVKAHVHTFVDYDQLGEGQDHVVGILNEFYETHKDDLWALFRLQTFYAVETEGDEDEADRHVTDLIRGLVERLLPIVNSSIWQANVRASKENWLTDNYRRASEPVA